MSVPVQFDGNRFCFKEYPGALLEYKKELSEEADSSFERLSVEDSQTKRISAIFVKADDLSSVGFPLTVWKNQCKDSKKLAMLIRNTARGDSLLKKAIPLLSEHLSDEYLTSFKDKVSLIKRMMNCAVFRSLARAKERGVLGMYFDYSTALKIFINLKKTPYLGNGAFGKVRKVLWLNPLDERPQVVAKKVMLINDKESVGSFKVEIAALRLFSEKRGIISLIAGGKYDDKLAIFMPAYRWNAYEFLYKGGPPLSLLQKQDIVLQLLDGLRSIAEKGIHNDIKLENIFLRMIEDGRWEAVIGDLGRYRSYHQKEYGLTPCIYAPPEYHKMSKVSGGVDVWAMGLCLYDFFVENSENLFTNKPEMGNLEESRVKEWTAELAPNWILKWLIDPCPRYAAHLINRMLNPALRLRITAREAFEFFRRTIHEAI